MSALALGAPTTSSEAPELSPRQLAILRTVNSSGPQIDGCVARYLEEQPGQTGKASVTAVPDAEGRVREASVETPLPQARSLRACLERVAKGWSLPPPKSETAQLTLQVPVVKGQKFRVPNPGEQKEPKKRDTADEDAPPPSLLSAGATGFLPSGW